MKNRGISLLELNVSIAIVGALLVLSYFSFANWTARYKIERTVKELYTDLQKARVSAMAKNRDFFIVLNTTSYIMYEDGNEDGDPDPEEVLRGFPKKIEYPLNWNYRTSNKIKFDGRGHVSPNRTVWIETSIGPDADCLTLFLTRIIVGQGKYNPDGTYDCRAR